MRKNDFRDAAVDLSYEIGAQHKIDGDEIVWWFEESDKRRTKIPPQGGDPRSVDNFKTRLRRAMDAVKPAWFDLQSQTKEEKDRWKAYLDKCLDAIRGEFETKFETIKGDINASTDIALDAGLKVDGIAKAFQGIFGSQSPTKTVSVSPLAPSEHPKMAIAPALPKAAPKEEEVKGLDVLKQVKEKRWADILKKINEEFELDDLEGRVLYFLHECGPCTPHDLRESGVWKPTDSATHFLEEMEARPIRFVRFLEAEKKWVITIEGIKALAEAEEPLDEPEAPSAFTKINEGLTEALAFARGEPNHAKVHVPAKAQAPTILKPTLTVVPARRILEPTRASRVMPPNLSVKVELLIYLYWDELDNIPPKTTAELMRVVPPLRGYGPDSRDMGTTASMAKGTGHLEQKPYETAQPQRRGRPWLLTPLGREVARRKLGEPVGTYLEDKGGSRYGS